MTTRMSEFALGTGHMAVVDTRGRSMQAYVHLKDDCPARSKNTVGVYPTERMARAAIPNVKACKSCR